MRLGRECIEPGSVARGRPSKQRLAERARQAAEAAEQQGGAPASSAQELPAMQANDDCSDEGSVADAAEHYQE